MKRSAVVAATIVAFAFTGCSTIRQYHLAPENNESTPTTYVVDIGTPLAPLTDGDKCPSGQDCTPVGQPTTTTVVTSTPIEPCADSEASGECLAPSGSTLPTTIPNTTPTTVCDGNVTGECS